MRNTIAWFAVVVLLAGAAAAMYYRQQPAGQAPRAESPGGAAGQPTGQQTARPPVRYPVPGGQGGIGDGNGTAARSLPSLDKSDGPVRKRLADLFGAGAVKAFFNARNIIQRVVVTLDNVTGRQLPLRFVPVKPVGGQFRVTEKRGQLYLSPNNFKRYAPYIRLAEAVDGEALVGLYVRFYPLFQQAYESLGYKGYFNDRLVAVLKSLLDTPEVQGPVKLVQPSVYYKYADPHLESLAAGQKILLRMGTDNARRIKAKLRELRQALMRLGPKGPP